MPRARSRKRGPVERRGLLALLAAGLATLALRAVSTSSVSADAAAAFVAKASAAVAVAPRGTGARTVAGSGLAASVAAKPSAKATAHAPATLPWYLGCAALWGAAAATALRAPARGAKAAAAGRRAVVACHAHAPLYTQAPVLTSVTTTPLSLPQQVQVVVPVLTKAPAAEAAPAALVELLGEPLLAVHPPEVSQLCGTTCAPATRRLRCSAALRVGSSRQAHRRGRGDASRGAWAARRAARRHAGAALLPAPEPEVRVLAYDASIVRMKIQTGLKMKACLRSERGSQGKKAPSASKCCSATSDGRIQEKDFGEHSLTFLRCLEDSQLYNVEMPMAVAMQW